MKNIKKITYLEIKKLLISKNINPISDLNKNAFFTSLNSIKYASDLELTFFNDTSQLNALQHTKAKACLINKNFLKYLPTSTESILVENTYNSFAILSNLFSSKDKSNGIISDYSLIDKGSVI